MSEHSLMHYPEELPSRNELRSLLQQYLEEDQEADELQWESFTTQDGLPHDWIYDLYADSQNRIWVATWGGGLGMWDGDTWHTYTEDDGLFCNKVTCIREDAQGQLWLATDNGLNLIQDGRILEAGLPGKSILSLVVARNGDVWAGCWRASQTGAGLFRLRGRRWERFSTHDGLPGLEILKVQEDSHGRIWVGTYEQGRGAGAACYDGTRWLRYTTRDGLIDNCVYSMFEDPSGNMWFGTIGGLTIFDGMNWHSLTEKDGLADQRVYSMMIDSQKKMWFGTENGVSRFDSSNWITYRTKDGLIANLVRAILEAPDGSLWFGTYPYQKGHGGISVARTPDPKSLPDRLLDMLPGGNKPELLGPAQ